jgi:hypothetical protein
MKGRSTREPAGSEMAMTETHRTPETAAPLRSALFVDFDNVFISLKNSDPEAARAFANEPHLWLDAIVTGALMADEDSDADATPERRILVRRCYANPSLMRYFRGAFLRAGFQIIDCPSLTGRGKNSADITMVIEALDLIGHETRFDEFIVLSSDADFTPLLTRLRLHDRRSIIYSNAVTASAYRALCDGMVEEEALIALLADEASEPAEAAKPERPAPVRADRRPPERGLPERTRGERARDDRGRQPPRRPRQTAMPRAAEVSGLPEEITAVARRVAQVTGAPLLPPATYAALFRALAAEVDERGYALSRTVSGIVARLAEDGVSIRPQSVAFVVKGLSMAGTAPEKGVDARDYAKALRKQLIYLASTRNLDLTADERLMIGAWIIGGLRSVPTAEIIEDHPAEPTDADFAASIAAEPSDEDEEDAGMSEDAEVEAAPPPAYEGAPDVADHTRKGPDINSLLERIRGNKGQD